MRRVQQAFVATAVMGAVSFMGAPAALAACPEGQVFSDYSQTCVLAGTAVRGDTAVRTTVTSTTGSTLPFTGGEVALAAAVGLTAVGVGTAMIVAGRRRATTLA